MHALHERVIHDQLGIECQAFRILLYPSQADGQFLGHAVPEHHQHLALAVALDFAKAIRHANIAAQILVSENRGIAAHGAAVSRFDFKFRGQKIHRRLA